jgi:uncharacterized protein (TIGR02118 family)
MEKVIVLYGLPKDPDHFRRYYEESHLPIVKQMPFLIDYRYSFDVDSTAKDVFCVFEATFPDRAHFEQSMNSEAGVKASEDTANYATGGLSIVNFSVA